MYRSIENAKSLNFSGKAMSLGGISLSFRDVESITVFLTCSSHKDWKFLDLDHCYILDHGVHILYRGLTNSKVTITSLWLRYNDLTETASSAIIDITISCRVKVLDISDNKTVGEDENLYAIISDPSSELEELYMSSTQLSNNAAIKLFTALSDSKKLRILAIGHNDITDEACDAIIMAMKKNTSLVELHMHLNSISGKCAQFIVEALQHNSTLQLLGLPAYPNDVAERIRLSAEEINKKRESRNCQVKLEMELW